MIVATHNPKDRKPHILMLLTNPFRPDPRVLNEARSLRSAYDVTVWALDREGKCPRREEVQGIRVERVRLAALDFLRPLLQRLHITLLVELPFFYLRSLRWLAKDCKVVHCHDLDTLPLGVSLGKLKRAKVVFDAHEDFAAMVDLRFMRRILLRLERLLMPLTDAVLVVGEIMKNEYRTRTKKPIYIVGNWKDPCDFQDQPAMIRPEAIQAKTQGRLIVSYLTGINANRLILPLVEAVKEDPDVFVVVAGGQVGSPLTATIEHAMAELSNGLYLGWLGPEQLNAYFAFSDVVYYCLRPEAPNNRYSASNTIFSALAAGKAIITTPIGEGGRIVQEAECGIVMPQATKEEILSAFAQLKDRDRLKRFQQNALGAAHSYSWRRAEETLLSLYSKLLGKD